MCQWFKQSPFKTKLHIILYYRICSSLCLKLDLNWHRCNSTYETKQLIYITQSETCHSLSPPQTSLCQSSVVSFQQDGVDVDVAVVIGLQQKSEVCVCHRPARTDNSPVYSKHSARGDLYISIIVIIYDHWLFRLNALIKNVFKIDKCKHKKDNQLKIKLGKPYNPSKGFFKTLN